MMEGEFRQGGYVTEQGEAFLHRDSVLPKDVADALRAGTLKSAEGGDKVISITINVQGAANEQEIIQRIIKHLGERKVKRA